MRHKKPGPKQQGLGPAMTIRLTKFQHKCLLRKCRALKQTKNAVLRYWLSGLLHHG